MPDTSGSALLQAVGEKSDFSPLIAVTNLSDMVQHVRMLCVGSDNTKGSTKFMTLAAHATALTKACEIDGVLDITKVEAGLATERKREGSRAMGIRLVSDGMPGSFAAFGLVPHEDLGTRSFGAMNFSDPKMAMSASTVFTGMPVGIQASLAGGSYIPHVVLANFSQQPVRVTIQFAKTEATPILQVVKTLTVPGWTTEELQLEGLSGNPQMQNSFVIRSNGLPGTLLTKLYSADGDNQHRVEALGKDEQDTQNAGSHPWSVSEETDSIMLLFNHSGESQTVAVLVSGGGTIWQKAYTLDAAQTEALSIRDLIHK